MLHKLSQNGLKYSAYINNDCIPADGFNYQVEIQDEYEDVIEYVSVMDDSRETVSNTLNEFLLSLD